MPRVGSQSAQHLSAVVFLCLFHVSVLNIKRTIVCAGDVDSYDGKGTERSCEILSAKIDIGALLVNPTRVSESATLNHLLYLHVWIEIASCLAAIVSPLILRSPEWDRMIFPQ